MDEMPERVGVESPRGRAMLSWEGKRTPNDFEVGRARVAEFHDRSWVERGQRSPIPEIADGRAGLILHGDNAKWLPYLLAHGYRGQVSLAYIDPPFDTGARYARRVYPRGPRGPAAQTVAEQVRFEDAWRGDSYLQFMYERLLLIKDLLSGDGSLYVHVDTNRSHAVKLLLDEVFGERCFQREIIWRIGWVSGFKNRARNWVRNHDTIFFYTKDPARFTFNKEYIPYPPGYRRRDGSPPAGEGYPVEDTWNCSPNDRLDSIQIMSFSSEKLGYPTQKNENLLARIIRASSNPGDLILDCFCGSGTTPAVAQALGRRWIACDSSRVAARETWLRMVRAIQDQADPVQSEEASPGIALCELGETAAVPIPAEQRVEVSRGADPDTLIVKLRKSPVGDVGEGSDGGRHMLDCIMIDPAYNGVCFTPAVIDAPKNKRDLVRGTYELPETSGDSPVRVAVRVIDVRGEEVLYDLDIKPWDQEITP